MIILRAAPGTLVAQGLQTGLILLWSELVTVKKINRWDVIMETLVFAKVHYSAFQQACPFLAGIPCTMSSL